MQIALRQINEMYEVAKFIPVYEYFKEGIIFNCTVKCGR